MMIAFAEILKEAARAHVSAIGPFLKILGLLFLLLMNLSGTINTFRLFYHPKLSRPHVVLNQFSDLTFPLGKCIASNVKRKYGVTIPEPDIRAIVLDKDNCIAKPHSLEIWSDYRVCVHLVYLTEGYMAKAVRRIRRARNIDCE